MLTTEQLQSLTAVDHWFRYGLPYVLRRVPYAAGDYVFLPLNRNLMPLGVTTLGAIDPSTHAYMGIIFDEDPSTLGWRTEGDDILLYDDADPTSLGGYFARLEQLMGARRIEPVTRPVGRPEDRRPIVRLPAPGTAPLAAPEPVTEADELLKPVLAAAALAASQDPYVPSAEERAAALAAAPPAAPEPAPDAPAASE
jgi:hypothetical protein